MSKSNNNNKEKERNLYTRSNFLEHKIKETKAKTIIDFFFAQNEAFNGNSRKEHFCKNEN